MKNLALEKFPANQIEGFIQSMPFYKEVRLFSPDQFKLLMDFSHIIHLDPNESIIDQGEENTWLYFLLKGRLGVFVDEQDFTRGRDVINYISPAKVFGDLDILPEGDKKATITACKQAKETLLFATDLRPFSRIDDFSTFKLETKLAFYRLIVNGIRWKLEVYKTRFADEKNFIEEVRHVPLFTGKRNTLDELYFLFNQSKALAELLIKWNGFFRKTTSFTLSHQQLAMGLGCIDD